MARPNKSPPALRRRIRCSLDPNYARQLEELKNLHQARKGRFGGLVRSLRRGYRVQEWKLRRAILDGWRVPAELHQAATRVLGRRPTAIVVPIQPGGTLSEIAVQMGWTVPRNSLADQGKLPAGREMQDSSGR